MAFNGLGTFSRLYNWANDAAAGTKIRSDRMDAETDGIASGLSTCICKDGQTTTTASIPFAAGMTSTTGAFSGTLTPQALLDVSGAAAGQIKFPATQNPSVDVNTLDDYEEGVWTPSIGGTATYTLRVGTYTKVGRLVTIFCDMTINVIGTGSATTLSGLPFTSNATVAAALYLGYFSSIATAVVWLGAYIDVNATSVNFTDLTVAAVSANTVPTIFQNGTRIIISGSYYV